MHRMTSLLRTQLALLLGLTACAPLPETKIARSDLPRDTDLTLPLAGMQDVTHLNNAFGIDLYQSLRNGPGTLSSRLAFRQPSP
jgi:hypothetical protein